MIPYYFAANSIGYLCPETSTHGVIHSVFNHAINLRLVTLPDRFVTITLHPLPNLPLGVQCQLNSEGHNHTVSPNLMSLFSKGGSVIWTRKSIQIESTLFGQISFSLENSKIWYKPIINMRESIVNHTQLNEQALTFITKAIAICMSDKIPYYAKDKLTGKLNSFYQQMRYLANLGITFDTLKACDVQSISRLIGLGEGLTPSGDDIACGVLASLYLLTTNQSHFEIDLANNAFRLQQALRAELGIQLHKTTAISQSYLVQAIESEFSEPVALLLQAITCLLEYKQNNEMNYSLDDLLSHLFDAVKKVQAIGSHSGNDILTGIIHGFSFITKTDQSIC
ncbi:DUF2877 domain-containing protein [Thorsellia anophelis]|uniref:DUF2877 domain-containing protein n=1 Tax=Thorsellia anophelis DSM 18579 TaxID=1123402 RepID=A0A1I0F8V0_9GAMM|nr:DUF2877 domain-containing protein [Thorsellia anophelis]SET54351.1 Protein of unknown function [Thorsellia anophelis DSM 18579]